LGQSLLQTRLDGAGNVKAVGGRWHTFCFDRFS
jgi:hypothetical protein